MTFRPIGFQNSTAAWYETLYFAPAGYESRLLEFSGLTVQKADLIRDGEEKIENKSEKVKNNGLIKGMQTECERKGARG